MAEYEANDIESWAEDYAKDSDNYALAADINRLLKKQEANNRLYRIHPKFLRTLSGNPHGGPLVKCATNICPGDVGPNGLMQAPGKYQAVLSRHRFNTADVYLRNVTARVDRNAIFITALDVMISDFDDCTLTVRFAGKADVFQKPDTDTTLTITTDTIEWNVLRPHFHRDTEPKFPSGMDVWSMTLDLAAHRHEIPTAFLNASLGLQAWTNLHLEQQTHNPPLLVGLKLSVRRPRFAFKVNTSWRLEWLDVIDHHPSDEDLEWPEEIFEFATTAGKTCGVLQRGGCEDSITEKTNASGRWIWETPLDRVWTDPRQLSHGLRDPLMDG